MIEMADKILAKASADEHARAEYQRRHKWYMDKVSSEKYLMMKGREEGREEGRKEGRKEGKEEEKRTIARKLVNKGLSIVEIASITGLKQEEIEKISNENSN